MKVPKAASGNAAATQAYGSVTEICGLKAKDVNGMIDGIANDPADQLKKDYNIQKKSLLRMGVAAEHGLSGWRPAWPSASRDVRP